MQSLNALCVWKNGLMLINFVQAQEISIIEYCGGCITIEV